MSSVCETPTTPVKRPVFVPDWEQIRGLVRSVSVHCKDIAAELGIRRETLDRHCRKVFGKPFRVWAKQIKQAEIPVTLFSPEDYKQLLRAYHSGALSRKDRNEAEYAKLRKVKSPAPPIPGGPSTATPLTERFSHYQVKAAIDGLNRKQVDIGVHVPATYILSVWLDGSIQPNDFIRLADWYERGDIAEWRLNPVGIRAVAEAVKLFHAEIDRRYLNPPKQ